MYRRIPLVNVAADLVGGIEHAAKDGMNAESLEVVRRNHTAMADSARVPILRVVRKIRSAINASTNAQFFQRSTKSGHDESSLPLRVLAGDCHQPLLSLH